MNPQKMIWIECHRLAGSQIASRWGGGAVSAVQRATATSCGAGR